SSSRDTPRSAPWSAESGAPRTWRLWCPSSSARRPATSPARSTASAGECIPLAEQQPVYWRIRDLTAAYAKGTLSPVEVTEALLARLDAVNAQLHAYITCTPELARRQAEEAAERYRRGERAPLLGVPVSIKDAFDLADYETTFGSLTCRGRIVRSDSGAVARLRRAGVVIPGKTNVPEFCHSATNENLLIPDTANPWDPSRTSGGSSGGAAASVGGGLATAALGSDGGGSIR